MKGSTPMISQATSEKIKLKIYDTPELLKDFQRFMISETHCGESIKEMIDVFSKILMGSSDLEIDEDELGVSVDDVMLIAGQYMSIQALMAQVFAAGLTCGRAKFDESFLESFSDDLVGRAIDDIC